MARTLLYNITVTVPVTFMLCIYVYMLLCLGVHFTNFFIHSEFTPQSTVTVTVTVTRGLILHTRICATFPMHTGEDRLLLYQVS